MSVYHSEQSVWATFSRSLQSKLMKHLNCTHSTADIAWQVTITNLFHQHWRVSQSMADTQAFLLQSTFFCCMWSLAKAKCWKTYNINTGKFQTGIFIYQAFWFFYEISIMSKGNCTLLSMEKYYIHTWR